MPSWQGNLFERAVAASMSRAQFFQAGGDLGGRGGGLRAPACAAVRSAATPADPSPIPGGFDENFNIVPSDPFIHVLPPAIGFEMATITDFDGVIAAAEIQGTARERRHAVHVRHRHALHAGPYVGMDGRHRTRGRSASSESTSTRAPWATRRRRSTTSSRASSPPACSGRSLSLAPRCVVDPGTGTARFRMQNVAVPDFHNFFNAISPFPSTLPGHVSFDVRWAGGGERDGDPRSGVRLRGHLRRRRGDDLVQGVRRQPARRHLHVESRGPVERQRGRRPERNGVFFT